VGRELGAARALLAEAGVRVSGVVRMGRRPVGMGDRREMVFRQTRVADGSVELTVCRP